MTQSAQFTQKHGRCMTADRRMCMWCGACVGICPQNAITLHETRIEFYDECNLCNTCLKACPVGAISVVRVDKGADVAAAGGVA